MNKILAVFHKEYLETRSFTLVFLLAGLLFPLIGALRPNYDDIGIFSILLDEAPVALGGIVAVWLNATFLCAAAFARERENGTFQTLRRVESDWRVAAAGKFGCVLVSTLILAAFFLIETILVAKLDGRRPFVAFERAIQYNSTDLSLALAAAVAATAWNWGVFWTGRSSRQMTAIFLAVLCPLVVGMTAETLIATIFGKTESLSDPAIQRAVLAGVVEATGLLALVAAPFKGRFGYREAEKRVVDASNAARPDADWNRVDVDKKSSQFSTLVSHVFAEGALLSRSPAAPLFELAFLFLLASITYAFHYGLNRRGASSEAAAFFWFYYLCFASGLFSDMKKDDSVVKERLSVSSGKYWLANAVPAFVVSLAPLVAYVLFSLTDLIAREDASPDLIEFGATLFLMFCVSLWSAALKGSRIVVWTIALAVFFAAALSLDSIVTQMKLKNVSGAVLEGDVTSAVLPILNVVVGLVFLVASYRIVVGRARYRKTPRSVAIPAAATVVLIALTAICAIPKLPGATHKREFDAAAFPQSKEEYVRLVDAARKNVEPAQLPPLFTTSDGQDAVAVELNDLRERFVDACELTRRRAASFVDADDAEAAFYAALRKALDDDSRPVPETTEPDALARFLADVPYIRPTSEQQADNNYLFAQFGDLAGGVKSTQAERVLTEARDKNDNVWRRALWNATQTVPFRLDFRMKRVQGDKTIMYREFPRSYDKSAKTSRYNAILEALDPTNRSAQNEIMRRLLVLRLAAQTPAPEERPWESIAAISMRKLVPETPTTPLDAGDSPLIALPQRPELSEPCADPETLVPCLDEQGRALMTPVYRSAIRKIAEQIDADSSKTVFAAHYDPNAPLKRLASVPKRSPNAANDEIVPYEFANLYPVFTTNGFPIMDSDGSRYYFALYNDVDAYDEPIVFVPEPVDKAPDFDCGGATLLTSRDGVKTDGPQISRVRALFPFRADGENSSVVPGLWLLRSRSENDGEQVASVKFLDSTGKEPLNKDGAPQYAPKRGLFPDKRRIYKPGYAYAIDLPSEFVFDSTPRNRKFGRPADASPVELRAVRATESGEYVAFNSKDLIVENKRVYTNFPAVAFLTTSQWILNPSLELEQRGAPVLLVEPLEPTTFAEPDASEEPTPETRYYAFYRR